MEKFKSLLTSKKFWTLVSAIVAALSAFFLTSCAASAKVQRHGVHIDTVRVDYIIRSRNTQITASCSSNQIQPISTLKSYPSTLVSGTSTECVMTILSPLVIFNGFSTPLTPLRSDYSRLSSRSSFMRLISFTTQTPLCSVVAPQFSSKPTRPTFGEKCLIAFVPIAFVRRSRRRGGRKGRPRPSTKTVPLGGSHL